MRHSCVLINAVVGRDARLSGVLGLVMVMVEDDGVKNDVPVFRHHIGAMLHAVHHRRRRGLNESDRQRDAKCHDTGREKAARVPSHAPRIAEPICRLNCREVAERLVNACVNV